MGELLRATSLHRQFRMGDTVVRAVDGIDELDRAVAPTRATGLPADPAQISHLPVFSPAISQVVIGRIMTLITAMQVLLGAVAVVTLLAAASMSIQERLREFSVLHAVGCSTPSSSAPRRSARAPLERSAPPSACP